MGEGDRADGKIGRHGPYDRHGFAVGADFSEVDRRRHRSPHVTSPGRNSGRSKAGVSAINSAIVNSLQPTTWVQPRTRWGIGQTGHTDIL